MTLCFELPKGSYATVVLKRLFHSEVMMFQSDSDIITSP
jgi:tRNA(Glu) U13 pseudouridine synthase TruD